MMGAWHNSRDSKSGKVMSSILFSVQWRGYINRVRDLTRCVKRTHASTLPPSWNDTWILKYDQNRDSGLELYSPSSACHLATSFRMYVDYDDAGGNDTVYQGLKRTLEATCTRGASEQASTLWIVDGQYTSLSKTMRDRSIGKRLTCHRRTW